MAVMKKLKQTDGDKPRFSLNLLDGLAKQNVVLMTGIVNAPVVIAATTLKKGAVIAIAFAVISMLTIVTCSFVPKKIVYTLRVIIYAVVGSIYYIPTVLLLERLFPLTVELIGIYMPLIVVNSLIFSKTESRFYLESKPRMVLDVFVFSAGFGIVCTAMGAFRELICYGTVGGIKLLDISISAFESPFGGFIMVGIAAGTFRALYNYMRNRRIRQNETVQKPPEPDSDADVKTYHTKHETLPY